MQQIIQEMTVRQALPFLSPAQQISLQPWAEEFGIPLSEFHMGHIRTYESLRLPLVSRDQVNAEVSTLMDLLESVGVGEEIRKSYQPLLELHELSKDERASLPERALKYIEKLESEIQELEAQIDRTENRLRKANWVKWSRYYAIAELLPSCAKFLTDCLAGSLHRKPTEYIIGLRSPSCVDHIP